MLSSSQWILTQKLSNSAVAAASDTEKFPGQCPSYRDEQETILGCSHYKRNCKLLAPCCKKLFTCIRCHDETTDHSLDRWVTWTDQSPWQSINSDFIFFFCFLRYPNSDCDTLAEKLSPRWCVWSAWKYNLSVLVAQLPPAMASPWVDTIAKFANCLMMKGEKIRFTVLHWSGWVPYIALN